MTPADLARDNAISFECKKDALRQNQSGDWKIAFTVQGLDMDERLTKAFPGTRYMAVLVEVGADELPVHQPAKEPKTSPKSSPQPTHPPAAAKREKQPWRDMKPSAQASMLCNKIIFETFLREKYPDEWHESMADPDECVRLICAVASKSELNDGPQRVIWHQLQTEFQAWELVGA